MSVEELEALIAGLRRYVFEHDIRSDTAQKARDLVRSITQSIRFARMRDNPNKNL